MDPVTSARAAREGLARGLALLQAPGLPPSLSPIIERVARAMGLLHGIESTRGAAFAEAAPSALLTTRQALGELQALNLPQREVDQALEAIAGSLGTLHQMSQAAALAPAPAPAPAPPSPQMPSPAATVSPYAGTVLEASRALQPPAWTTPGHAAHPPSAATAAPSAAAAAPPSVVGPGAPVRIEAALGAHSPTNFYKGLTGRDVIEGGGLFVATYQIPPIGSQVQLKVALPGGYEFDAIGVVRWARETRDAGSEAPPGFGAQLVQISAEARQLVDRYVRNREPLFHEDL